jgi:ubiquinone/menaquinone biosynthesis C-methylase UbiE
LPRLNDPAVVSREYADECSLTARDSLYADFEGQDVKDVLLDAVVEHSPCRVLEVGSGTGELARRLVAAGLLEYRAIDVSPRMVDLTRRRGISAEVGDVQALPFGDAEFDCVVAAWMLYHVPDLELGSSEIARVLRPGGRLVAVTNSERHLCELWSLVGHQKWLLPFTAENGGQALARHFAHIESRPVEAWLTLESEDAVRQYINASPTRAHLAHRVPKLDGPLRVGARTCVFVATSAT